MNSELFVWLHKDTAIELSLDFGKGVPLRFADSTLAHGGRSVGYFSLPADAETVHISVKASGRQKGIYKKSFELFDLSPFTGGLHASAPIEEILQRLINIHEQTLEDIPEYEDFYPEFFIQKSNTKERLEKLRVAEERRRLKLPRVFHSLSAFDIFDEYHSLNTPGHYDQVVADEMHASEALLDEENQRSGGALRRLYERCLPLLIEFNHNHCLSWDPIGFSVLEKETLGLDLTLGEAKQGAGYMVWAASDDWWRPSIHRAISGEPSTPESAFRLGFSKFFLHDWIEALAAVGALGQERVEGFSSTNAQSKHLEIERDHPHMRFRLDLTDEGVAFSRMKDE